MRTKFKRTKKVNRKNGKLAELKTVKSKRRRKPKSIVKVPKHIKPIHNWGGHLLNPPKDCKYRFIDSDKGHWVDFGCCRLCENNCDRYNWFKEASNKERAIDWKMNGVICFNFGGFDQDI